MCLNKALGFQGYWVEFSINSTRYSYFGLFLMGGDDYRRYANVHSDFECGSTP